MMVAEFRDLMVATYSEVSPTSCVASVCTLTGMAGGPDESTAALLRPQAPSSKAETTAHARTMPDTAAFSRPGPGRTNARKKLMQNPDSSGKMMMTTNSFALLDSNPRRRTQGTRQREPGLQPSAIDRFVSP